MNTNFISLKTVLDSLLDHPLLQDVTLERGVAYAVEFLQLMGVPDCYQEKIETVEVKNHKGVLPFDLYEIIQVRDASNYRIYNYSTSSFHTKDGADNYSYKRQGTVIVTSTDECTLEVAYRAMVVDGEGMPMIPENSAVTRALELYIKKKVFTILFDLGKISQQAYQVAQQDYYLAAGQARNALLIPSEDEWEAISNNLNSMLPRRNAHATGFKYIGNREILKQH
jgi:hypothetical protein